jgi:hypothetical protein
MVQSEMDRGEEIVTNVKKGAAILTLPSLKGQGAKPLFRKKHVSPA